METIKRNISKLNLKELKTIENYVQQCTIKLKNESVIKECKKQKIVFENINDIRYEYTLNGTEYFQELYSTVSIDDAYFIVDGGGTEYDMHAFIALNNVDLARYDDGEIVFEESENEDLLPLMEKYSMDMNKIIEEVHKVFMIIRKVYNN